MEVGVDARHLSAGRGVARYTRRLLATLPDRFPDDRWHVFVAGRGELAPLPHPALVVHRDPRPQRLLFGAAALTGRPRLDALLGGGVDVVWAPAPAPLALSSRVPFAVTVHDRSFELRPQDFTPYERAWHRLARIPALARRAQRVVCVSGVVAEEVTMAWGLDATRIRVVAPGVDGPRGHAAAPVPGTAAPPGATTAPPATAPTPGTPPSRPYLLAVGALEPRKAPGLLVRAHAAARARGLTADLVFAGRGRLVRELAGPGVRVRDDVTDAELPGLYAGALALLSSSHLEGFGLTPLEALTQGTPAVVSDLPVFAETMGDDGALRVPAGDEHAWADAMLRIERDAGLRERIVAAGRPRARALTWERTADGLRAALDEAAGG